MAVTTTITEAGAHASAAATDRIPALKTPFTPGTKGYLTPQLIATYAIGADNTSLGANWPTALGEDLGAGWADSMDSAIAAKLVRQVATYAALTALTSGTGLVDAGVYFVRGRSSNGDGGEGWFRYSSGSTSTADGGTILAIDGGGTGRFFRLGHNGWLYPEFFGTSSDWAAAFNAMFAALPTNQGRCKLRDGASYTLSGAVTCTGKNFLQFDISGAKIIQAYTGGPQFTFGTGAALMQGVAITGEGAWVDCGTTANQPLFYTRGVRDFKTLGFRAINCYQFHQWGNPADTFHSYIWTNTCEVSMRATAADSSTDAIQADGSLGVYFGFGEFFQGTALTLTAEAVVLRLTSSQLSSLSASNRRFDSMSRVAGHWDNFDWGIKAVDARFVNYEKDGNSRDDQMVEGGIYSEVTSGATQGGGEKWYLGGICSTITAGTNSRVVQIVAGNNASIGYLSIEIDAVVGGARATPVDLYQTGSGQLRGVHVRKLENYDFQPSDASQYGVKLDGAISGSVNNVSLRGKAAATYQAAYAVYNNTPTTSEMHIGRNIDAAGDVNTAIVYDPNIGDMSIGRWCELHADGSPRAKYPIRFAQKDFATSQTNVAMGVYDDAGVTVAYARVPNRARIIEVTTDLNASVAAGSLTIGAATGASIDTNLDIVMTSGDGGSVKYLAGSAALAAGDKVYARYTSDGSLTANIDGTATIWVQEM